METPTSTQSMAKEMAYNEKKSTGSSASIHSVAEGEVFAVGEDGVDFRTVGWIRAAMFFTKMYVLHKILISLLILKKISRTFAAGVLSIPSALYTLGAVAGAIFIAFWGGLNTCKCLDTLDLSI
jgi:hypothetical protein